MNDLFKDPIISALHQRVVKKLAPLEEFKPTDPSEYFEQLTESVVSQQLSIKVADTIFTRVKDLVGEEFTPQRLLLIDTEKLRKAGLSYSKASYIQNIAYAWKEKSVDPHQLAQMENEEVIEQLVKIKGIGRWTAEMFLMFTLARPDVFSAGDYGLRRAISMAYGVPIESKPAVFIEISDQWSPYRTLASRILWRSLELK